MLLSSQSIESRRTSGIEVIEALELGQRGL